MKKLTSLNLFFLTTFLTACVPAPQNFIIGKIDQIAYQAFQEENQRIQSIIDHSLNIDATYSHFSAVSKMEFALSDQSSLKNDIHLIAPAESATEPGSFDLYPYQGKVYYFTLDYKSRDSRLIETRLIQIKSLFQPLSFAPDNSLYYFIIAYIGDENLDLFQARADLRLTYDSLAFTVTDNQDPYEEIADYAYYPESSYPLIG